MANGLTIKQLLDECSEKELQTIVVDIANRLRNITENEPSNEICLCLREDAKKMARVFSENIDSINSYGYQQYLTPAALQSICTAIEESQQSIVAAIKEASAIIAGAVYPNKI
jgi:hypothetical protein